MFRILLGKKAVEVITDKASKYIAKKSITRSNLLEESMLLIEKEKLNLDRAKLDATFKTSQIAANAVRYAANLRALTLLGTAGILGTATSYVLSQSRRNSECEDKFKEMVSQRDKRDAMLLKKYSFITQHQKVKPMTPAEREERLQELIKEREFRDQELSAKFSNKMK